MAFHSLNMTSICRIFCPSETSEDNRLFRQFFPGSQGVRPRVLDPVCF